MVFFAPSERGVGQGQSFNHDHGAGVKGKNPVPDPGPDGGFFAATFWVAAQFSGRFFDVIMGGTGLVSEGWSGPGAWGL